MSFQYSKFLQTEIIVVRSETEVLMLMTLFYQTQTKMFERYNLLRSISEVCRSIVGAGKAMTCSEPVATVTDLEEGLAPFILGKERKKHRGKKSRQGRQNKTALPHLLPDQGLDPPP